MPRNMPFKIYTENKYMGTLSLAIVSISISIGIGDGTDPRSTPLYTFVWFLSGLQEWYLASTSRLRLSPLNGFDFHKRQMLKFCLNLTLSVERNFGLLRICYSSHTACLAIMDNLTCLLAF